MGKRLIIIVLALIGLGALFVIIDSPTSFRDILVHPWSSLFGSGQQLNATLIEVSENVDPVRAASRRLLEPLGTVSLIRTFPGNNFLGPPIPNTELPTASSDTLKH